MTYIGIDRVNPLLKNGSMPVEFTPKALLKQALAPRGETLTYP